MQIISWNVNGIRAAQKKGFLDPIQRLQPDILCIQETKAQDRETESALTALVDYGQWYNSAQKKGYAGTATLSKITPLSVQNDIGVSEHDSEGRVQCFEFDAFHLVNVYVPNSGQQLDRLDYRKGWDRDFLAYLKQLETSKPVIVCGDFNVAHHPIDLKNDKANYNKTAGYTQVEIDGMDRILQAGFVDVFRKLYPERVAYTYWSYRFKARERNTGWRIDYFVVSETLFPYIKSMEILTDIMGSDHCPIALEIHL